MIRGTTPVLSLEVEGESFEDCRVFVTIDQAGTQITKDSSDGASVIIEPLKDEEGEIIYDDEGNQYGSTVYVYLSQADTLELGVGQANVQIRWINSTDDAFASDIVTVNFTRVLLEEVIAYG